MEDKLLNNLVGGLSSANNLKGAKKSKSKEAPENVKEFAETFKKEALKKEEEVAKKEDKEKKTDKKEGEEKAEARDQRGNSKSLKGDLLKLILYRLAYTDPSLINISLRQSLGLDKLLHQNANLKVKPQEMDKLVNQLARLNSDNLRVLNERKEKTKPEVMGDPLASLRAIHTTLKEISREENIRESKIIQQLINKIEVKKLENERQVNIILNPNVLGQVAIQLLTEGNTVIALFRTTSAVTYKELSEEKGELIKSLKERGLKVDKVKIEYVESLKE